MDVVRTSYLQSQTLKLIKGPITETNSNHVYIRFTMSIERHNDVDFETTLFTGSELRPHDFALRTRRVIRTFDSFSLQRLWH